MSQAAYRKKVRVSTTGTSGWLDVPVTSPSLDFSGEVVDDTELATNAGFRTRIHTLLDWSISCDSNFTTGNAALELIRNALLNRTEIFVQYLPTGATTNGFQGKCIVENFNLTGEVGGIETVSITLQAVGALAASS